MIGGLTTTELNLIKQVLIAKNCTQKIILFGSRAKGNFKNGSDIDLAIQLKEPVDNKLILNQLKDQLENELPLPYFFDLVDYDEITNPELLEHINRVGIVLHPTS